MNIMETHEISICVIFDLKSNTKNNFMIFFLLSNSITYFCIFLLFYYFYSFNSFHMYVYKSLCTYVHLFHKAIYFSALKYNINVCFTYFNFKILCLERMTVIREL